MPSDYEQIRRDNVEEYGKGLDRWARRFLDKLYSDETHFVYELLQNAEDAGATRVKFTLHSDCLEFEHDGRKFNERDVRAICGLADTDKYDDLTQIGSFGLGFKSVHAYTRTPEIHSGTEHFAIDKYVQPRAIQSEHCELGTRFRFPFDHEEKTAETSRADIAGRLKDLGIRTLLFLKNLNSIEYDIVDESTGIYLRQCEDEYSDGFARVVRVLGQNDQANEREEQWLIFRRDISDIVEADVSGLAVEAAFQLSSANDETTPRFQRASDTSLVVYFPTEKETKLGFLMQGPYRTTPARDNISHDNDFNLQLVHQTGELVVDALLWLRDRGWLTVQVLETMPLAFFEHDRWYPYRKALNNPYNNTLFEPIFEQVLSAVQNEELIPAHDGGYVAGECAILAGNGTLPKLLDNLQLQQILNAQQAAWISSDISERHTGNLWKYLKDLVNIEEFDLNKFIRKLTSRFFEQQSDKWMERLYETANEFQHHSIYEIRRRPIIRLKDDSHIAPYDKEGNPRVFLPSEQISRFPIVKADLCKSKSAMEFLRDKLELQAPDSIDEVRRYVLPKYKNGSVSINDPAHFDDIFTIMRAIQADSVEHRKQQRLIQDLKKMPFLQATNSENVTRYCSPSNVYFLNPELEIFFEGNPNAWFVSPEYDLYRVALSELGVESNVRIERKGRLRYDNRVIIEQRHGWHVHGINGFDPDCTIDGLVFALNNPNPGRSQTIWNRLLIRNKFLVKGVVEKSTRQDFLNPTHEARLSTLGKHVAEFDWLPDPDGQYVRPSSLSLEDLPEGFTEDEELAAMLGMRTSSHDQVRDIVEAFGIEDESATQDILQFIELRKRNPHEAKRLLSQPNSKSTYAEDDEDEQEEIDYRSAIFEVFNRPITSRRTSAIRISTQSRDLEKTKNEIAFAKSLEPETTDRRSMVLSKKWEGKHNATRKFLHSQYDGQCQICGFTFEKRTDRSPYFEGVYLVSYKRARWLDRPGNVLCLCPNHVSEFLYGTVEAADIFDQIKSYQDGELHDIEITLCENIVTVRFTRDHITELIALLESE